MFRLCLLCVFVSAAVFAAPVPKMKAAKLYLPVQVGDKKVVDYTSDGRTTECTQTVTKVSVQDGVYTVTTDNTTLGDASSSASVCEVSESGVFHVKSANIKEALLKLPTSEGDTWTSEATVLQTVVIRTFTTGKEEEVEVPAGKFTAVTVECVTDLGQGKVHTTKSWYAPNLGLVKHEFTYDGETGTTVLKSFTPGK